MRTSKNLDHHITIYPTDTVWGLGAPLDSQKACQRVGHIKGHPSGRPTSILFAHPQQVLESFALPRFITVAFLQEFFALETTLGLPLKLAQRKIPPWVTGGSDWVGVRCLEFPWIAAMITRAGGPVTTTSLNLQGRPTCLNFEGAQRFRQAHCPEAQLLEGDGRPLSGQASTIAVLQFGPGASLNIRYLRRGKYSAQVELLFK